MLGTGLKTGVDTKYFGSSVIIDKVILNGQRYIYRIRKDKIYYTLKGYQIPLENVNPRSEESRRRFMQTVTSIGEAYQEYFLGKVASLFNQHFSKPLEIDQQLEFPSNTPPQLFIEILLEYSGEPLSSFGVLNFDLAYNLMRQSTNALSLLQSAGIAQVDINPSNLVYNKRNDLLTLMNNDIEPGYGAFNMIRIIEEDEFTLPGTMKERRVVNVPAVRLPMGNVDVYCWAMCFYAMLVGRSVGELVEETNVRKLSSEAGYNNFMRNTRLVLENIPIKELNEKKKKEFVIKMIYESLNLNPRDRPTVSELQKQMKAFEKSESIDLPYSRTEREQEEKILRLINNEEQVMQSRPSVKKENIVLDNEIYTLPEDYQEKVKEEFAYEGLNEVDEVLDYGLEEVKQVQEKQFSIPELSKTVSKKNKYEIEEYRPNEVITDLAKDLELDEYDYLLQNFSKGVDNKEYEDTINKKSESAKKRHNKDQYNLFEYAGEEPLLTDYKKGKDKYELPEFTKEEDKYMNKDSNIPELVKKQAQSIIPDYLNPGSQKSSKIKYSDIMKTPEKYEIPDFIKEINLGDTENDKELPQEDVEQVNKVLYNVNKEEGVWDIKEEPLYVTPGKAQHEKISKENEYHDILDISKPKDTKKSQFSSSIHKEKQVLVKETKPEIVSSANKEQPKQEEMPKLPLHKLDEGFHISNLEELLKDPMAEINLEKGPIESPRDNTSEYIPKMPMDLSPQNTPSDDIIGYNRPIERSQFTKKDEVIVQSTYVAINPVSNPPTEIPKKPSALQELPKNDPQQKKIETKPPSIITQGSTFSSKVVGAPMQRALNPLSKVMI